MRYLIATGVIVFVLMLLACYLEDAIFDTERRGYNWALSSLISIVCMVILIPFFIH